MDKLVTCTILYEHGQYRFGLEDEEILEKYYDISRKANNDLNTINDLVNNIIDELPDKVIIYLDKNSFYLAYHLLWGLVNHSFFNTVLFYKGLNQCGKLEMNGHEVAVINKVSYMIPGGKLPDTRLSLQTLIDEAKSEVNIEKIKICKDGIEQFYTGLTKDINYFTNIKFMKVFHDKYLIENNLLHNLININSVIISDIKDGHSDSQKLSLPFYHKLNLSKRETLIDETVFNNFFGIGQYSEDHYYSYYEILQEKDLGVFLKDVACFGETGKVNVNKLKIVNMCMWVPEGCTLTKVSRCVIDTDGVVKPCLNSEVGIGKYSDNYFQLMYQASERMNRVMNERNCNTCKANSYCSKCAMLPQGITQQVFCTSILENRLIVQYVMCLKMINMLQKSRSQFMKENLCSIEISNNDRPLVAYRNKNNTKCFHSKMFLFLLNNVYYGIAHATSKIIRLDKRLVFLAECIAQDYLWDEIGRMYANKFQLTNEDAMVQLRFGWEMLDKYKII